MFITRISSTFGSAALVTLVLLLFMSNSIHQEKPPLDPSPVFNGFGFVRTPAADKPKPIDRIAKPKKPTSPPEPQTIRNNENIRVNSNGGNIGIFPPVDKPKPGQVSAQPGLMALVKIAPEYPNRALSRGIEGYVIVEYTVTRLGTVENARVIEAFPNGYFERSALRAIERFRYNPETLNGKTVNVPGMQHKFTFKMENQQG